MKFVNTIEASIRLKNALSRINASFTVVYVSSQLCKWTNKENSERLLFELKAKAEKLPFAKNHIIITKLFLKTEPDGDTKEVLLPKDIINMVRNNN